MTWLTWRQFRAPALLTIVLTVAIVVLLAVTGSHLHTLYGVYQKALPGCTKRGDCDQLTNNFLRHDHHLNQYLGTLIVAIPALIGVFWGPPLLAREFETGSYRLAWTQSVTRTRWLEVKIGFVCAAAVVAAGALSLMFTWWSHPINHISGNEFSAEIFSSRGAVPIGYAVFAFIFGATAGLIIRRTVPAMAVTLVGYVAIHLAVIAWVRPHLAKAKHLGVALRGASTFGFTGNSGSVHFFASGASVPNSLVVSERVVDASGHVASSGAVNTFLQSACPAIVSPPAGGGNANAFSDCLAKLSASFHLDVAVIPPSRYWDLQLAETGLYLAIAAALAATAFWWIRHRQA
jgi:hypothetical protein